MITHGAVEYWELAIGLAMGEVHTERHWSWENATDAWQEVVKHRGLCCAPERT